MQTNNHIDTLVRDHVDVLSQRYSDALGACGFDSVLVLAGSPQMRPRDDQAYAFHPDPYFSQWVPLADAPVTLRYGNIQKPSFVENFFAQLTPGFCVQEQVVPFDQNDLRVFG